MIRLAVISLLFLLGLCSPSLVAQEDPFGDFDSPEAEAEAEAVEPGADDPRDDAEPLDNAGPAADEADDPFAPLAPAAAAPASGAAARATRADGTAAAGATTAAQESLTANQAAVDAIRGAEPKSAVELFRAVDQLIRLERPDVAAEYLKQLRGLGLSQAALADLHRQFGTAAMLRLARAGALAPDSSELAQAILRAAQAVAHDPANLDRQLVSLASGDRAAAIRAAAELLRAGPVAVEPLLRAMAASPADAAIQSRGRALLQRWGSEAREPLLALQHADDPSLRVAATRSLAVFQSPTLLVHLVGPLLAPRDATESGAAADAWQQIRPGDLPPRHAALALLQTEAERAFEGITWDTATADQMWERWVFAPREKGNPLRRLEVTQRDAALISAGRLYADLVRLEPQQPEFAVRLGVCLLHQEQLAVGLDATIPVESSPAFALAQDWTEWQRNEILQVALDRHLDGAAIGAATLLGNFPAADSLAAGVVERPAPLIQALTCPDRRVRVAACQAILRLQPPASFAGSGRLVDQLCHLATARGERRIVVAHPHLGHARNIAGLFSARGFQTSVVAFGHELLAGARASADVEWVLLSDSLNDDTVWSLVEELRANPVTANLPIVILARPDRLEAISRMVESQPRVLAWTEDLREEDLTVLVSRLQELAGRDAIAADRRLEQAVIGLQGLRSRLETAPQATAELLVDRAEPFAAIECPALVAAATHLLAATPLSRAQVTLADFASQHARPLALRQQAASGFRQSCEKYGVLLARPQVVDQYARYNESRNLDEPTQKLLGEILDAMESPAAEDAP